MKNILFTLLCIISFNYLCGQELLKNTLTQKDSLPTNNKINAKSYVLNKKFINTNELINMAKQQNGTVEIKDGDTIITTRTWKYVRNSKHKNKYHFMSPNNIVSQRIAANKNNTSTNK